MLTKDKVRKSFNRIIASLLILALVASDVVYALPQDTDVSLAAQHRFRVGTGSDEDVVATVRARFRDNVALSYIALKLGQLIPLKVNNETAVTEVRREIASALADAKLDGSELLKGLALDELSFDGSTYIIPLYRGGAKISDYRIYLPAKGCEEPDLAFPYHAADGAVTGEVYVKVESLLPAGTRRPPAGSIYSVFSILCESGITTPEAALTLDQIAVKLKEKERAARRLSNATLEPDVRNLYSYLRLIRLAEGERITKNSRFYVPEPVFEKAGELLPVLSQFTGNGKKSGPTKGKNGKGLRPAREALESVYRDQIAPILPKADAVTGRSAAAIDSTEAGGFTFRSYDLGIPVQGDAPTPTTRAGKLTSMQNNVFYNFAGNRRAAEPVRISAKESIESRVKEIGAKVLDVLKEARVIEGLGNSPFRVFVSGSGLWSGLYLDDVTIDIVVDGSHSYDPDAAAVYLGDAAVKDLLDIANLSKEPAKVRVNIIGAKELSQAASGTSMKGRDALREKLITLIHESVLVAGKVLVADKPLDLRPLHRDGAVQKIHYENLQNYGRELGRRAAAIRVPGKRLTKREAGYADWLEARQNALSGYMALAAELDAEDASARAGEAAAPAAAALAGEQAIRTIPVAGKPQTAELSEVMMAMGKFVPGYLFKGRFKMIEKRGEGGYGVVWKAHDNQTGIDVAIKFLVDDPRSDEADAYEESYRFDREIRALKKFSGNPNIVRLVDNYTEADRNPKTGTIIRYYAMELLDRRDIAVYFGNRDVDVKEIAGKYATVASALASIHGQGLAHRDVKPQNVLMGPDDTPVIIDLGIVKKTASVDYSRTIELTKKDTAKGTPLYLAPERLSEFMDVPPYLVIGVKPAFATLGCIFNSDWDFIVKRVEKAEERFAQFKAIPWFRRIFATAFFIGKKRGLSQPGLIARLRMWFAMRRVRPVLEGLKAKGYISEISFTGWKILEVENVTFGAAVKDGVLYIERPFMKTRQMDKILIGETEEEYKADVYALGLMMYQALTGTMPFEIKDVSPEQRQNEIAIARLRPYASVRSHNPAVSPEMEAVVMKCLALDPRLRYRAAELSEELARIASEKKPVVYADGQRKRVIGEVFLGLSLVTLGSVAAMLLGVWYLDYPDLLVFSGSWTHYNETLASVADTGIIVAWDIFAAVVGNAVGYAAAVFFGPREKRKRELKGYIARRLERIDSLEPAPKPVAPKLTLKRPDAAVPKQQEDGAVQAASAGEAAAQQAVPPADNAAQAAPELTGTSAKPRLLTPKNPDALNGSPANDAAQDAPKVTGTSAKPRLLTARKPAPDGPPAGEANGPDSGAEKPQVDDAAQDAPAVTTGTDDAAESAPVVTAGPGATTAKNGTPENPIQLPPKKNGAPKGSPATLLRYLAGYRVTDAGEFILDQKKAISTIEKAVSVKDLAGKRGGNDSSTSVQRELNVLYALGLVVRVDRDRSHVYYLSDAVSSLGVEKIIQACPLMEMGRPLTITETTDTLVAIARLRGHTDTNEIALIFDCGNVITKVNYGLASDRLQSYYGVEEKVADAFFKARNTVEGNPVYRFEHGLTTEAGFLQEMGAWLRKNSGRRTIIFDMDDLESLMNSVFYQDNHILATIKLIRRLKTAGVKIRMLTTTNSIHYRYITETLLPTLHLSARDVFASHKRGVAKPARAAYLDVVGELELKPEQCLFIDDLPENVEGARAAGLNAFHFNPDTADDDIHAIFHEFLSLVAGWPERESGKEQEYSEAKARAAQLVDQLKLADTRPETKPSFIAIGSRWFADKVSDNPIQKQELISELMPRLRALCDARGIRFISGDDEAVSAQVRDILAADRSARGIVIAGEDTVLGLHLEKVQNVLGASVDDKNISRDSFVDIVEMVQVMVELSRTMNELDPRAVDAIAARHPGLGPKYISARVIRFLPKASKHDYNTLKKMYEVQVFA